MFVRAMHDGDVRAVVCIAGESMANPWSTGQVSDELDFSGGLQLVAEQDGLCGYAFFRQSGPEAELLQLAVLPESRRQGIASALLRSGLGQLSVQGAEVCFLEVRRADMVAHHFYEQAGFYRVGLRKKYYSRPVDDAVIMRKSVNKDRSDEDNS